MGCGDGLDAEGTEAVGHEADQNDANAVDSYNSEQKFIFPDGLLPRFAFVENQSQEDVDHIGGNKILGAALGIPKPPIFEPHVPMGGIGHKIIGVGIVHIANNHAN